MQRDSRGRPEGLGESGSDQVRLGIQRVGSNSDREYFGPGGMHQVDFEI